MAAQSRRFQVVIAGDSKGARKAVKETEDSLGHLSIQGRLAAGGLRVIGTGFKGLGVAAAGFAVAGTAALVGFGKSVIQTGIEYQDSLNNMQAVTHSTDAVMAQVAQRARDLGNDLTLPATSAADAANAMTELAKGNLTAQQAMAAAKGTLVLAAAAQVDGARAADIQANAINAFSLKASDAGHVSDVLANAANAATGEINDFALGLQQSSAVAAQFHISLDDTVTALALFANKGIQGSDAGTSLKSTLLALASPSKPAAEALNTLGLRAFDAQGKFVGLASISEQLATAQKHLSQQAFTAAVSTAFGSDAARAAGVFAAYGAAGFNKMATAVGHAGGAAAVANAKMKGLGGAIQGFQSQVETIKIDVFTREAPHLEKFIRLLSDKLPAAADEGLHGLDSLTAFVQKEIPAARQEAARFAPAIQHYVSDKLAILGHAATDVAEPALRGIGNILDGLVPKAASAGEAVDNGLRAGIDAAAKVAHQFETDSRDMGAALGEFASGVGDAAHDALPALKVALAAASGSATVFIDAFTGATRILAPFTSDILLTIGAIKGLQLGVAGVGAAKGQIAKITTSFGQMADKASFAAGLVTQKVGTALGKDLETSATAGAAAMTGVRTGLSALGAAIAPVTIGLLAIGYANQKMAEEQQHAIESSKAMYDQLRQGGGAADQAQASFNTLATQLDHVRASGAAGAAIAGKMSDALVAGKKASDDAYAALSPLERANSDVAAAQAALATDTEKYGANSLNAAVDTQNLNFALTEQQSALNAVSNAMTITTDKVQALAGAQAAADLANSGYDQSLRSVKLAQDAYNDAVAKFGPKSQQAKDALVDLKGAQAGAEQAARAAADAARNYAVANDTSGNAATAAQRGNDAYRSTLSRLASQLAPNSALRARIQDWINALDRIPREIQTHIAIRSEVSGPGLPGNLPATPHLAAGGPVNAGQPVVVGDGGRPELFVPNVSGRILPRVPTAATAGGRMGGGNTYNINVSVAPGGHPAETGRQIVYYVAEYEKRSGKGWRS